MPLSQATAVPGAPSGPDDARARARRLAPGLAARAGSHDASGTFPEADFDELRANGFMGLMTPVRLGGCGASFADYTAVATELAAGAGATALVFNMHAAVTGALAHAPEELVRQLGAPETFSASRDRVLARAAEGALYAVAMSERGAGSRLSRVTTAYRRTDGGFRVTGSKAFVSGAGHADAYLVAARDAASAEPRVSYFLVPAGSGVRVEPTWDSMGMRATGSHDVHFDAEVPQDALVGGVEGLAVLLAQVMPQWLVASYAAVYVGVARAALREGTAHLRERGLHTLPAVRARMGRADAAVAAAALVVAEAARRVTESPGEPETNHWVWRAKLTAGDTAAEVASSVLEAAGTSATRRGHPLERIYRDARCGALQPATSDVCADWLGVAALGGDPEHDTPVPRW
ncbi:acyl-CoA dehydrogenase family protein [Streptomyces sp. TRM 70351]|uniref:acyl-CoA dehydrogenase family protein n=1 Tax=Streptomyces sp. TRM 70351 TaxID=3116552 RepID=UPI002E7AD16C|nr:acyl-CoA dehydrogenase family protein [Streptomyces sp. TRM 70351]MEE1930571.1 acyl-CoA dehydrogenase family protein [Streptomyces sp. TRM 70351]